MRFMTALMLMILSTNDFYVRMPSTTRYGRRHPLKLMRGMTHRILMASAVGWINPMYHTIGNEILSDY
jgi:hypothetical protein